MEANEGKGLRFESSLQRKWNILTFFIVISIVSFSPMLFAGTTYWDIQTGVYFRAEATGGDIDFDAAIVATQIRMVNSIVLFTDVTMGGDYISLLGMSASSNCDMTLLDIENDEITYEVTANAGQTSTTKVKIPSTKEVSQVDGASSWSFASSTNILTVTVIHASTQEIIVYYNTIVNPLTEPITDTINVIYGLQTLVLLVSLIASLGDKEPKNTMMGIITVNVAIFVLLRYVEGLF